MMDKMKPCPWCKKIPKVVSAEGVYYPRCKSKSCGIEPVAVNDYKTKKEAIEAWNKMLKAE